MNTETEKWTFQKQTGTDAGGRIPITTFGINASDGRRVGFCIREEDARLAAMAPQMRELLETAAEQCKCSLRERDSGHLVDCWVPRFDELAGTDARRVAEEFSKRAIGSISEFSKSLLKNSATCEISTPQPRPVDPLSY